MSEDSAGRGFSGDGPTLLEGLDAFSEQALQMVSEAKTEIVVLSQKLDTRTYGSESFVDALSTFIRQHAQTRVRVLVSDTKQAVGNSIRLIEFGRKLTSFFEFRELSAERRQLIREEYIIIDGRVLLYREDPTDLESRYYGAAPHKGRLKLKEFDALWNESTVAQELRKLGI